MEFWFRRMSERLHGGSVSDILFALKYPLLMKITLITSLLIFLFASASLAQNTNQNLLEKVDLLFSMPGEPTPEKVGFDNPKSYWKVKYELVLSDSFTLEKLGRCMRNLPDTRLYCPLNKDGKLSKKIRKGAVPITRGEFIRRGPMSETDREVTIPVALMPEVIDIFNRSVGVDGVNPTFILFVKAKASTRTADKVKFRKKLTTEGIHPLKFYYPDMKFADYWNIAKIGLALGLTRSEDGTIRGFHIYRF